MVRGSHLVVDGLEVRHLNRVWMGNVNGNVLLHWIRDVLFDWIRDMFLNGIWDDFLNGNCDFLDDWDCYGFGDGDMDWVGMGNGNQDWMRNLDVNGLGDGHVDLFVDWIGNLFGDFDVVVNELGLNLSVVHLVVVRAGILVSTVVSTVAKTVVGYVHGASIKVSLSLGLANDWLESTDWPVLSSGI